MIFFSFGDWCGLPLSLVEAIIVAAYIKQLAKERAIPTVKQHMAAIRIFATEFR